MTAVWIDNLEPLMAEWDNDISWRWEYLGSTPQVDVFEGSHKHLQPLYRIRYGKKRTDEHMVSLNILKLLAMDGLHYPWAEGVVAMLALSK